VAKKQASTVSKTSQADKKAKSTGKAKPATPKPATPTSQRPHVSVRHAENGYVVTSYDPKTGREKTHIANDKSQLTSLLEEHGI